MTSLDWVVLVGTIAFIAIYGAWKYRHVSTATGYLRGEGLRWPTIGLSIMATQASAVTFLSVPGQAYEDGMGFVQFYFGLPLAMIIISAVFVPKYYKLNVLTAYEYLEQRFDLKVRLLAAFLFLVGRGLATGISIYAPAIVLSSLLGWSLYTTNLIIGTVVIIYTVTGGSQAVSQTQKQQMIVIMGGIVLAAFVIVSGLPKEVSLSQATGLAGALGRLDAIDFSFDFRDRYNVWSGVTGGLFLQLAYFGTDQSQVQRYLGGKSVTESRLGLLFNGMVKIPMQCFILYIGVLVFSFYLFEKPPVFFNQPTLSAVMKTPYAPQLREIEAQWDSAFNARRGAALAMAAGDSAARSRLESAQQAMDAIRVDAKALIKAAAPKAELKDSDYIFISWVLKFLPSGLVGLLLAVILSAAMSSTASELSSLAATSVVDFYKRVWRPEVADRKVVFVSKVFTVFWGGVAVAFATFATLVDNLIQAVNIIGSLFYGVVLGIFLLAFFFRLISATPTFVAAVLAQIVVVVLYFASNVGFLWFNIIGCALVIALAQLIQWVLPSPNLEGV